MKKRRLNEKMGGGSRIGLGGMNSTGPHYKRYDTNYPSGYHTGGYTGDADSQISQRHSLATLKQKEQELEDYYAREGEQLNENVLNLRVKKQTKYMLVETLNLIESTELLKESFVGKQIHKWTTLALMMLFDDATGELSGLVAVVPLLYKNVYEIHQSNKAVEAELSKPNPDQKVLDELRSAIIADITDIVNAIILAFPGMGLDDGAALLFSLFNKTLSGKIAETFEQWSSSNPRLSKALYVLSYPLGGTVIFDALVNIDRLDARNVQKTLTDKGMPDGVEVMTGEPEGVVIDVTDDTTILEALNTDVSKVMRVYFSGNKNEKQTLNEFFARMVKLPLLNEKEETEEKDEEEEVSEINAGGVPGVGMKFGLYNSDGSKTSKKQHKNRLAHAKSVYGGK